MSANKGNILLKLLLVAALIAGAIAVMLFGFRTTALVAVVARDAAVDAVPGSVEVFADRDLQQLKIEGSGRVVEMNLDPGSHFKQGDVLLKLDTKELERSKNERMRNHNALLEQRKIVDAGFRDLELAEKALQNVKRLRESGRASEEDENAAQRSVDAIKKNLELQALQRKNEDEGYRVTMEGYDIELRKMELRAPMDGMIEGASAAPGALIGSGSTVATFYSDKRVVLARISEEDFSKVQLGDAARVQLLSLPNRTFDAKVSKILPFANPQTRRYTVHLEVNADPALLTPNGTGEVTITTDLHENVPVVARRAISYGNVVYVVKSGRVEKRQIEVGFRGLNFAEVTKGLEPGEQVIVENLDQFRDGQRVKAVVEE